MNSSLEGRLRKYKLPKSQALLPLFEAIVNSIDSLMDIPQLEKFIKIYTIREDILRDKSDEDSIGKIIGFCIEDNGAGFNKENFEAFNELDTLNKIDKGGKGIGRLAWLKAFDNVEIQSIYKDGNLYKEKKFKFHSKYDNGTKIEFDDISNKKECNTLVKIFNIKDIYTSNIPKKSETIANKIIEHCLYYFTLGEISFSLYDEQNDSNLIDLNEIFAEKYQAEQEEVVIDNNKFNFIKVFSHINENKILYCADNRVVKEDKLSKYIVELKTSLPDNNYVQYFIAGDIFNQTVNSERTDFESGLFNEYNVDFKKLEEKIINYIDKSLSKEISQQKEENKNYLNEYVKKEAPQYKNILKYATEEQTRKVYKDMKADLIEQELFNIKYSVEKDIKDKSNNLASLSGQNTNELIEKVTALNSTNLAEYIIYRKTIISMLTNYLKINEKSLEDDIHKLIYPMQTIENKDYSEHNLWLIDDRLAFHSFCASDIQFKKFLEESQSLERPDILIFDKPFIYTPNKDFITSIILIEFKKPKRNDYSIAKNPITQIIDYLAEIDKSEHIIDNDGLTITISKNTQRQIYIIADLETTFENIIKKYFGWLIKSSDGMGYYGYEPNSHAYVEVITYEKLLKDARNRNRIFFEKLGI